MNVDYGKIVKYDIDRGFGFIEQNFCESNNFKKDANVFFHIKTIRQYDSYLSQKLKNFSTQQEFYFWYEFERTSKGIQVSKVLNPESMELKSNLALIKLVEQKWSDVNNTISYWLENATQDILGADKTNDLKEQRRILIQENEKKRVEIENQRMLEQRRLQEIRERELAKRLALEELKEIEFQQLVDEMRNQNFAYSSQVSNYIRQNCLGNKYKHISGHLEMTNNGNSWIFTGGFPRDIYARLCSELQLENNGSSARAGKFTSFNDLNNR